MSQSGGGSWLRALALAASVVTLLVADPLVAQIGEQRDSVGEDAVDAVTQPLSDLNLRSKEIPDLLLVAQSAPYDISELGECADLRAEIARLDDVLGADADEPPESDGVINRGLKAGGNLLGGLIPFRGLVRQVSGAEAEHARWEAAIYAGVARRSFIKGLLKGRECRDAREMALDQAHALLGLDADGEIAERPDN